MNLQKRNPDVWNSIGYIGERQDFFRFAKSLLAGFTDFISKDSNFEKNMEHTSVYVVGTVGGVVIQRILFVWKNSRTGKLLDKHAKFAITEEELDELLLGCKDATS